MDAALIWKYKGDLSELGFYFIFIIIFLMSPKTSSMVWKSWKKF